MFEIRKFDELILYYQSESRKAAKAQSNAKTYSERFWDSLPLNCFAQNGFAFIFANNYFVLFL